jgi:hypothetical protein
MARATRPRLETTAERRSSYGGRPPLARKSVASCPYRIGVPRGGPAGPSSLVPSRAAARTRYSRQASLARHCLPDSLPAWWYLRRGAVSATVTMFNTRHIRPVVQAYPTRAAKVRYKVEVVHVGCNNPWAASMRPYKQRLLGRDSLGAKTLDLMTTAWAKSTSDTYKSAIKPYFQFCEEQGLPPLAVTAATMARCIAWIGERGTIKAPSLRPCLSEVNGFFKDHGAEPIAQGDLEAKVRRGLAPSQVSLHPSRTRMYLQARTLVSSLRQAKDLRTQLIDTWTHAQTDLILLFRACLATVLMAAFFVSGERELSAGLETCCVLQSVESSSTTEREKGQRGTSTERKLLCENYRTRLTLTSRNYYNTSTLPVPSSPPERYRTDAGPLVYTNLRQTGQRTPLQHGYNGYFVQYTSNLRIVSRGLRTPYERVQLLQSTLSVPQCRRSSSSAVGRENRT